MSVLENGGKSNSEVDFYRCAAICFIYGHLRGSAVDRHLRLYISNVDEMRFFGPSSTSNACGRSWTLSISISSLRYSRVALSCYKYRHSSIIAPSPCKNRVSSYRAERHSMPVAVLSYLVNAFHQFVGKKASHRKGSLPRALVYLNKEMVF